MIRTSNIYGGVNLAPADKDVHTYNEMNGLDGSAVPEVHVAFIELSKQEAASIKSKIPELIHAREAFGTVQSISMPDAQVLSAVILPGADTRVLAPNRQQVTDMAVPIGLGRSIRLTRNYNSFFDPGGAFGSGWTFDLPRLLMTKVPVKRDGKRSRYRVVPHLVSPLGTMDIQFDRIEYVEPYGIEIPVAKDHPEIVGVAGGYNKIVKVQTHQVLFRDGTEWHFDDDSRLVLVQAGGVATRYAWDSAGRLNQIVGYVGTDALAEIQLGYDRRGRVVKAKAKQSDYLHKQMPPEVSELEFEYDEDSRLSAVISLGARGSKPWRVESTYSYDASHLSLINGTDGVGVSFGYDERGQLLWEKQGDQKVEYIVTATSQGTSLTHSVSGKSMESERWIYDARMRLWRRILPGSERLDGNTEKAKRYWKLSTKTINQF